MRWSYTLRALHLERKRKTLPHDTHSFFVYASSPLYFVITGMLDVKNEMDLRSVVNLLLTADIWNEAVERPPRDTNLFTRSPSC